jgi:hypothetical protein
MTLADGGGSWFLTKGQVAASQASSPAPALAGWA